MSAITARTQDAPTPDDVHAREILEQGYTIWPALWGDDETTRIRDAIKSRFEEEQTPIQLWSEKDTELSEQVILSYTGVTFYRMVRDRPEIAELLLKQPMLDSLRQVLGQKMSLELVGAVVCNETRPFFAWHTHVGGFDDGFYQSKGGWPAIESVDRITTLLYLDDIDEENGPFLVYPRQVGETLEPPHDPNTERWPGEAEVHIPRGSLVAFDQCTWHTALPMKRQGLRIFIGCSFRREGTPAPDWEDRGLRDAADRSALLASVLHPAQP